MFLRGDLTDRAALLRGADRADPASGRGFTDAKSGPGLFPTGPFLAVPRDLSAFLAEERIATRVDGALRQQAEGRALLRDVPTLLGLALAEPGRRFPFAGGEVPLLEGPVFPAGAALLTGTPEGVIFRPPGRWEIARGVGAWLFGQGRWRGETVTQTVVERHIARALAERRYLQPGQVVRLESARSGAIEVVLVAP